MSAGIGWAVPSAHADPVTYVNSVNVRPGFNFPSGDAAIAYGRGVCDKIAAGRSYGQIIGDIKVEVTDGDDVAPGMGDNSGGWSKRKALGDVFTRLERMGEVIQIVYLTDDPDVGAWARSLGSDRALVLDMRVAS